MLCHRLPLETLLTNESFCGYTSSLLREAMADLQSVVLRQSALALVRPFTQKTRSNRNAPHWLCEPVSEGSMTPIVSILMSEYSQEEKADTVLVT